MKSTYQLIKERVKALEEENEILKNELQNIKTKQTKVVFDTLASLISKNETCTYRYLIYDLLGLEDYVSLMSGLTITNMLVDYQDDKEKINNAIEYINSHWDLATDKNVEFCILRDRVYQILKGE